MGDYGIAISQSGYDVKTCADRFMAYSSAFRGLKVFSKTTSVLDGVSGTITHNFGYYAPFIVFNSSGRICHDCQNTINAITINLDEAIDTFTTFLFLEDFTTLAEGVVGTGADLGDTSVDFGIRVSKEGYDVKNCTDDQLMLSSEFFTNLIDKKGSVDVTDSANLTEVSHGLGYTPDFFLFYRTDGTSFIKPFSNYKQSIDATSLKFGIDDDIALETYLTNYTAYYIIFKTKLV